jgi:two-component system, chemotaxis family, sensor kinase CheA
MGATEHEFLRKLLATFTVEAKEHIDAMSSALVALEHAPPPEQRAQIIESVFREAHSLKGAARAVNLLEIEGICQYLENEFAKLKARGEAPSLEELDRLLQKVDTLAAILAKAGVEAVAPAALPTRESREHAEAQPQSSAAKSAPLPAQLVDAKSAQPTSRASTGVRNQRPPVPDTVRVTTFKVSSLLQEAEELIPAKAAGAHRLSQLRDIQSTLLSSEEEWKKARPLTRALQRFLDGQLNGGGKPLPQYGNILPLLLRNQITLQSIRSQLATFRKNIESDSTGKWPPS